VLQLLLQGAPQGTQLLLGVLRDEAGPSTGGAGGAGAAEAGPAAVDGDGAAVVAVLVVVHEVVESHDLMSTRVENVLTP